MSEETAKIARAIIGSRLDHCNAPLIGMSDANFNELQRVQNTLVRDVTDANGRDHVKPVQAKLHWLPIRARITFRILTRRFKSYVTRISLLI